MRWCRVAILHLVVLSLFGALAVTTIIPMNVAVFVAWGLVVLGWANRRARLEGLSGWIRIAAVQGAGMVAIVIAAVFAPVKDRDLRMSHRISLPKQVMTLAELEDPARPGWDPHYYFSVNLPEGLADRAVRFSSRDLTVREFIAAIESQTPLRHHFGICGNGYTILRGDSCSMGLYFGPR